MKTFFLLFFTYLGAALILYPLAWFISIRKEKYILKLAMRWHFVGILAVGFISAFIRLLSTAIIGKIALDPTSGFNTFFAIFVPIFVAIIVINYFKTVKATKL